MLIQHRYLLIGSAGSATKKKKEFLCPNDIRLTTHICKWWKGLDQSLCGRMSNPLQYLDFGDNISLLGMLKYIQILWGPTLRAKEIYVVLETSQKIMVQKF